MLCYHLSEYQKLKNMQMLMPKENANQRKNPHWILKESSFTEQRQLIQARIETGIELSRTSISLPNRLIILPTGVVSKKLIEQWRMFCSNWTWRVEAARRVPKASVTTLNNTTNAEIPIKSTIKIQFRHQITTGHFQENSTETGGSQKKSQTPYYLLT